MHFTHCSPESQPHPGMHQKECGQQVKRDDSPSLVFLCPCVCPLQLSTWQTEPVKQLPQKQSTKTKLAFWSPQFPISAYYNCLCLPVVKRQEKKREECSCTYRGEYTLQIYFVSLAREALLHSPLIQTAQGLSHPVLEERIQILFSEKWIRIYMHQ